MKDADEFEQCSAYAVVETISAKEEVECLSAKEELQAKRLVARRKAELATTVKNIAKANADAAVAIADAAVTREVEHAERANVGKVEDMLRVAELAVVTARQAVERSLREGDGDLSDGEVEV